MCYSAIYKGMYWLFGSDWLDAFTIDPLHTTDEEGYLVNEEAYLLPDATEFPTWREVIESIPDRMFTWQTREDLLEWYADYLDDSSHVC